MVINFFNIKVVISFYYIANLTIKNPHNCKKNVQEISMKKILKNSKVITTYAITI